MVVGIAAGVGLGKALDVRSDPVLGSTRPRPEPSAALVRLEDSFSSAAEFAMPSVVHITTHNGAPGDPMQEHGVGSGVIVSDRGHVLTNNHVAEAAGQGPNQKLLVRFADGREVPAKVVGTDSETDLALLKIEVPREVKLVPASFADSEKVRVGEMCLAIGSPFGYNHSVTHGIVSAKHRQAGGLSQPYQDFIQTDAAINPGNSGGALVNLRGELIGINSAIISETRASDGIGLAISSNLAKWVADRLLKDGRIRRAYLGIRPVDFGSPLLDAMKQDYGINSLAELLDELGLKEPRGVFVYNVEANTPAAKAGLKDKDVILEFNGKPVTGQNDMLFKVAEVSPGTPVVLKILRDKREKVIRAELGERQPIDLRRSKPR
jgi:S1-C subfamily serine protease